VAYPDLPTDALGHQPSVAVLMAVHAGDDSGHLDEALASMRAQTYENLRLFVYCDGPLPSEHEMVLARYLRCATGFDCVVRGDTPAGLATGLNRLIDHALCDPEIEFMARMDADDVSVPHRIARQVEFLRGAPEVTVVGTWVIECAVPGKPTFYKRLPSDPDSVKRFMLYRSPLAHPTVMFRRRVFERGHRYNISLSIMQDYELWSRLVLAGEVISNVGEYLLWFRMTDGFFQRRGGLARAWGEARMRFAYARQTRQLTPLHLVGVGALFIVRLLPGALRRVAYQRLR
jgi:glycosyltransferase involved in cell wall biosynthesis